MAQFCSSRVKARAILNGRGVGSEYARNISSDVELQTSRRNTQRSDETKQNETMS